VVVNTGSKKANKPFEIRAKYLDVPTVSLNSTYLITKNQTITVKKQKATKKKSLYDSLSITGRICLILIGCSALCLLCTICYGVCSHLKKECFPAKKPDNFKISKTVPVQDEEESFETSRLHHVEASPEKKKLIAQVEKKDSSVPYKMDANEPHKKETER